MSVKTLLKEAYNFTKSSTGYDPSKPGSIREVLVNDDAFGMYKNSLSEGLTAEDKAGFNVLAENTRIALLENSTYSLNPYETLALPLLRVFYPKTIAKDLVTVIPMSKPEIIRGFIKASFKRFGDSNTYMAPSNTDITAGPKVTVPVSTMTDLTPDGKPIDILAKAGVNSDIAHIEKNFMITAVNLDGETVNCQVTPTVDGTIAATVQKADGSVTDTLTGRINYLTGILELASVNKKIDKVAFKAQLSLEENTINPRASFSIEKIRLIAQDRQISTNWTIQMQQDIKALYDIELQSELVSAMGQQIVLDVDRQIVQNLIYACERMNGPTHNRTFNKNPSQWEAETGSQFAYGPKQWMENVLPVLNDLSAAIYVDTNIAAGNILACNPLHATIFESLQEFRYNGSSSEDGDLGYRSAEVAGGKWKVLVSPVVPQGKSLCLYKPTEQIKCTYIFAPYVPCVLTPYPLGNTPSLTILSRNGEQLIRPAGISVLNITDKFVPRT